MLRSTFICFSILFTLNGLLPGLAEADGRDALLQDERNTIDIFNQASSSTVFITNLQKRRDPFRRNVMETPIGSGTGFVWDEAGHIVTNFHVIRNGNSFSATLANGTIYDAELVGFDENKDLAVLKIDAPLRDLNPVNLGDSHNLLVGQKVLAIGNPFGLDQTLTTGVISALGREIKSVVGTTITDVIQTDASINPGNSGGPLLNSAGELIGVNTAIFSTSGASAGIGFAVPVNTVNRIVPQILKYGHIRRPGLGISIVSDDVARRLRVEGVIIRGVAEGSPAAKANLIAAKQDRRGRVHLGDVIVAINDDAIITYDDLYQALDKHQPGDTVILHHLRDGKRKKTKIRLQELK